MAQLRMGSGGFTVPKTMQDILNKPGYLSMERGGSALRILYQDNSMEFNPTLLSEFAASCFFGDLPKVMRVVESGDGPDLMGTETPYKFGYATFVIAGAQRLQLMGSGKMEHIDVLKYLLSRGAPPDTEDVVGHTPLHHIAMGSRAHGPMLVLARVLLESGANVDHRNRYGEPPLLSTIQTNQASILDVFLEFGADIDLADADGMTARKMYLQGGPQITATVTKWIRKRAGTSAPMDEIKRCENCGKSGEAFRLLQCGKCHTVRYCGVECQRTHWKTHKSTCRAFSATNTVVLKPCYDSPGHLFKTADFVRGVMGYESPSSPASHARRGQPLKNKAKAMRGLVIKVQVPYLPPGGPAMRSPGDLLVYTRTRDFVCSIRRQDSPGGYDRVSEVVRTRGVGGAKAYFAAELTSDTELVVKVDEVLAEQPF